MSEIYFVWRLDSSERFRCYGLKNHVLPEPGRGELFWTGTDYADGMKQAKIANRGKELI